MPPKRKAKAAAAAPAKKSKKAVKEEPEEEAAAATIKDAIAKLKQADKGKVKKFKPDSHFPLPNAEVYEDFDAMLNQTNICANNNKFYIIQVLKTKGASEYFIWNRWGRVGETGQSKNDGPFSSADPATKSFEKKFKDKTRNAWANRASFNAVPGKYTLLEMAGEEEEEEKPMKIVAKTEAGLSVPQEYSECSLDKETQALIDLIFNMDMFKEAMQSFDLDVKKMPLGKLSKAQIAKGYEALEELEDAIENGENTTQLKALTSRFYTIIPHSFGRTVPPSLTTVEAIQKKYDMLSVLGDIEIAQSIQKDDPQVKNASTVPHPLDRKYKQLDCTLERLKPTSQDYKILEKNYTATKSSGGYDRLKKLNNIWKVNRHSEGERFAANDKIEYRKLLWHGTSVAVVSAILKTGLRIMPHSGGRVGKGMYFASQNEKSACYAGAAKGKVIMFLNEVALGNMHRITRDDSSLKKAPAGYDSVLACGRMEPDEKLDVVMKLEKKDVIVPQGKPKNISEYSSSSFSHSEYLVYREDQCRIRYMLEFNA